MALLTPAGGEAHELPARGLFGVLNLLTEKPGTLRYAGSVDDARRLAEEYREAGFYSVDLGAQSSHYASRGLGEAEELQVLLPVVEALARDGHTVCVETARAAVIEQCAQAGARVVNLTGGIGDPDVVSALARTGCAVITAFTPRDSPHQVQDVSLDEDLRERLAQGLADNMDTLRAAGVRSIIADAGIGFSYPVPYKEFSQYQVETIRRTPRLAEVLGAPVLVAVPRLRNLWTTAAFATLALEFDAHFLRCHDPEVASIVQLLTEGVDE